MEKEITIVIPCYNEVKYIGRTLRHIFRQHGCKGVRIIIADAGSTDGTLEKIELLKDSLGLRIEVIRGGLPSIGRNSGAKLVSTPYILFIDSDITFTHKYVISECMEKISSGNYDMIGTTPAYKGRFDIRAWIMFGINKYSTWLLSKTRPFAIGGFTMISRNKFNELGGYDEKAHQSEDWLLSRRIAPNRFKLVFDLITQDNRRFKKYGYLNMIKLMLRNWKNRNNLEYFYNSQNYWD